jgi:hypothetical protein
MGLKKHIFKQQTRFPRTGKPMPRPVLSALLRMTRPAPEKADGFLSRRESGLFRNIGGFGGRKAQCLKHSTDMAEQKEISLLSYFVRVSPATAAGVSDSVWSLEEFVEQTSR